MKQLKSVQVGSVVRVSAILGAVAGVLVGVILFFVNLFDHRVVEGFATLIMAPFLYAIVGALVNGFMAWVYNRVASRWGGIQIDLE